MPTLFWLGVSDHALMVFAWIGLALSLVVLAGYANAIIMAILWAMYMSIVHVGQIWYGYGWETQLLETGFLAIFLCPLIDPKPFPKLPPPLLVIWLFRWLGFRIMIGAGLIKLRGDPCWRDLTCLYYHYQTQPIPNPISRYLHFAPHWFHNIETAWNHFIELIVPWFSFGPRLARQIAGILLISFQIFLIISGNLSFLNYLTIVPLLACLDDTFWRKILPNILVRHCSHVAVRRSNLADYREEDPPQAGGYREEAARSRMQFGFAVALTLLVAYLSITPIANLVSNRQLMNASFDPLDLVNTYGAFGSVGKERNEIIFEGTNDSVITGDTQWKEYEFKAKPGTLIGDRRLSLRISHGSTGRFGSRPWLLLATTRGRSILSGSCCITIRGRCRFSLIIRSRTRRRTTFGPGFIVINSRRGVIRHGGNVNKGGSGCRRCPRTTGSCAALSKL